MLETREFCFFSLESYFIKAIKNFFLCLHILIWTLEGLEEFSTVMQTRDEVSTVMQTQDGVSTVLQTLDFVSGLHNCLEFSQPLSCWYQATQTRKTFSIA